ncbi:MAG: heat-inducible transcriptional repressor HrcA [Alphaproteobacteria bacterium]|nr:heat-inducible transcriptional repressor HrcA [Alphaproteobacteria bacterium]
MMTELNERSRTILKMVVDAYVATGAPVGSRTLARQPGMVLSPASIRNVMADLEALGLLHAPHTSAGRVPTDMGLRLFIDGILEVGDLAADDRNSIESHCRAGGRSLSDMLEQATSALAGLSSCAGLVLAPKADRTLKQIEFVQLGPGRVLVILVSQDGMVENRVIEAPLNLPISSLTMAANYLNHHLGGKTLAAARKAVLAELEAQRAELDGLTARLVQSGLAVWSGEAAPGAGQLIVKGQSRLLSDVQALSDLERIRKLFDALETRESMLKLLDATGQAEGVQIFIGAENALFADTGCAMIVAPFTPGFAADQDGKDGRERVIGAIGVIGPTRINYARIIPLVDYTAKVIGKMMGAG